MVTKERLDAIEKIKKIKDDELKAYNDKQNYLISQYSDFLKRAIDLEDTVNACAKSDIKIDLYISDCVLGIRESKKCNHTVVLKRHAPNINGLYYFVRSNGSKIVPANDTDFYIKSFNNDNKHDIMVSFVNNFESFEKEIYKRIDKALGLKK